MHWLRLATLGIFVNLLPLYASAGKSRGVSERTVSKMANGMLEVSVALQQKLPLRAKSGIREV
jgi:hypothetical protein